MAGPGHFHPVPTRPVFGPRPELMAVPVSAPMDDAPQSLPELESVPVPEDSMPDEPDDGACAGSDAARCASEYLYESLQLLPLEPVSKCALA